jgi:hypothetical protein
MTALELIPLATVSVKRGEILRLGETPFSRRVVGSIAEGRWEGERLRGSIVGAGGDWAIPSAGNVMLLDVRQVIQTDDDALIYVTYKGRCDRERGTYTVAPTFETSDARYDWLNAIQAVGQGRSEDDRIVYEMFEVR